MQSLEALNLIPVWVNPEHLAATARIILTGHRLKALGVLEGSDLVGVVTEPLLRVEKADLKVRDVMERADVVVDISTPLRHLAETFWKEDLDFIPVLEGDRFRGVATPNMLLREMARSWDPLTGLSWSDRLREWGVENLKQGREITILFVDLDEFGSYNKKYGHIVGDRVLQKVADMIEERTDRSRDLLVRYGGDEFAVGTIRDQGEALELARSLHEGMSRIRVSGSDESVTFSIGVQGGKRTKERENVHYAATLDNL
ncbi:MAG TPA: GGDEF domain-containing protein, partial [Fimbriimonadaceae bacterium]|nr:GGDEF domain-containing protein [Fimbriimonadaceae bacterium]